MFSAILAFLSQSWFGQLVGLAINWWTARQQAQTDQNSAVSTGEAQHENDGAQSAADQDSSDAQNAALDQLAKQMDNPTKIVVQEKKP